MTKQERIDILERLEMLNVLDNKINTIITMLSDRKNSCEPLITFSKPNNVENTFIEDRQKELFNSLDCKEVK